MLEQKSASGLQVDDQSVGHSQRPAKTGASVLELEFVERVLLRHCREQVVDGDDPTYPRQELDQTLQCVRLMVGRPVDGKHLRVGCSPSDLDGRKDPDAQMCGRLADCGLRQPGTRDDAQGSAKAVLASAPPLNGMPMIRERS